MKILKIASGTISFLMSIFILCLFIYGFLDSWFSPLKWCGIKPPISELIIQLLIFSIFIFYLVFTKFWKSDYVVPNFSVKKIIGFLYSIIVFLGITLNLKSIILSSYAYVVIILLSPHIIYLFMSKFWESPKTKEMINYSAE